MNATFWLLLAALSWPWQLPDNNQVVDNNGDAVAGECSALDFVELANDQAAAGDQLLPAEFELLVWNIYKQSRTNLVQQLEGYAATADVMALQEVVADQNWQSAGFLQPWYRYQAAAFNMLREGQYGTAGVSTIARVPAIDVCGWWAPEPWLPFPKTALLTAFQLPSQQLLWLVNLHAINFTVGTEDYLAQLIGVIDVLKFHSGPIIVTGDFNNWSDSRHHAVKQLQTELGLKAVTWSPDLRVRFFGRPIDHVFYRGLNVLAAVAETSDASDHGPLRVRFTLE
ncbi:endonuclease/exonuclease/phosphatase family protein [Neiella sp. HB171785]|uniref:Endonuclease/exonuclease/phosphatase family protein n=1 Tax=Neiella litorisoli TaxID=2771431 RepID=A0A8J6QST5_9GAMM|nr:endonuclease/exonuclease/phosphatase family protein [Neiella litorisoli]MBD1390184.1 endonuclease/exonuclease/phosphatase family protein [Neiella litorisoli]